jgi:hypothetical protein
MSPRAKKEKPPAGADDLVRESAGVYASGDGRFKVEKSDVGWYLIDTQQANEFGQQLIHGPLATLDAVRSAIPGARAATPLLRAPRLAKSSARPQTKRAELPPKPPPPPQSWIDRLPDKEAAAARRLMRALEKEGLGDAEELVRRHRDDVTPLIATRVLEHRLRELVNEQPEDRRTTAENLVRRVVEILAIDGTSVTGPMPGWSLVETDSDTTPLPRNRLRPSI